MKNPHHKYQDIYKECPICNKKYNQYWKIVSHIRKCKCKIHQDFLEHQEQEYVQVYLKSTPVTLHQNLADTKNIFAGLSFANSCPILRKTYTSEELETIRRKRISNTLSSVSKTLEHNAKVSKAVKKAWKEGKYDTNEYKTAYEKGRIKRKISMSGKNNPMYGVPSPRGAGRGKGGVREDIGHYVRSRWEANVCRICLKMGRKYKYEPKRFYITINDVEYTYCPDLYFPDKDLYYEIKGHARSSSKWMCKCKTCVKNKKVIPAVIEKYGIHLILVGKYEYMRMKRIFVSRIPNWEQER